MAASLSARAGLVKQHAADARRHLPPPASERRTALGRDAVVVLPLAPERAVTTQTCPGQVPYVVQVPPAVLARPVVGVRHLSFESINRAPSRKVAGRGGLPPTGPCAASQRRLGSRSERWL